MAPHKLIFQEGFSMKYYTITVNGVAYSVSVEETAAGAAIGGAHRALLKQSRGNTVIVKPGKNIFLVHL